MVFHREPCFLESEVREVFSICHLRSVHKLLYLILSVEYFVLGFCRSNTTFFNYEGSKVSRQSFPSFGGRTWRVLSPGFY